jgi:hypothetical protein
MGTQIDRRSAYKTLRPLLVAFFQRQIEDQQDALDVARGGCTSFDAVESLARQRSIPVRLELLHELMEDLDSEFAGVPNAK